MLVPHEINMVVSSNPALGAINRSNTSNSFDSFEVQLDDAFEIPKDALNVTVEVARSSIWFTSPNIITGVNDTIYVFGDDDTLPVPVPQLFTVVLPQGLYDRTGLNNAVQSGLEALGARTLDAALAPLPLISIDEDTATQKVVIRFNYTNSYVNFGLPQTFREIIGFDALQYGPYAGAPLDISAPNVAAFNQINSYVITGDIVSKGIRVNNRYAQILTDVPIDVLPGSQIVYTPFNPPKIQSNELAGSRRTNFRFQLTDDSLRPVNTASDYFSFRMVIKYLIPTMIA